MATARAEAPSISSKELACAVEVAELQVRLERDHERLLHVLLRVAHRRDHRDRDGGVLDRAGRSPSARRRNAVPHRWLPRSWSSVDVAKSSSSALMRCASSSWPRSAFTATPSPQPSSTPASRRASPPAVAAPSTRSARPTCRARRASSLCEELVLVAAVSDAPGVCDSLPHACVRVLVPIVTAQRVREVVVRA